MTLFGGITLCVLICVLVIVTVILVSIAAHDDGSASFPAFFCCVFVLGGVVLATYYAVHEFGRARDNDQVETGVVQEVVGAFTLEGHGSFALLRKWGSGEEAVYYRLVRPIPEGVKCVLFRGQAGIYEQDPAAAARVAAAVSCPVQQEQPAERP